MAKKREYKSFREFLEVAVTSESLRNNDPEKWVEYKKNIEKERLLARLGVKK